MFSGLVYVLNLKYPKKKKSSIHFGVCAESPDGTWWEKDVPKNSQTEYLPAQLRVGTAHLHWLAESSSFCEQDFRHFDVWILHCLTSFSLQYFQKTMSTFRDKLFHGPNKTMCAQTMCKGCLFYSLDLFVWIFNFNWQDFISTAALKDCFTGQSRPSVFKKCLKLIFKTLDSFYKRLTIWDFSSLHYILSV